MINHLLKTTYCLALFSFMTPSIAQQSTDDLSVEELVEILELDGHIEGGFFRRTYEASDTPRINTARGERFSMTSIFYLLASESPVGHFHMNTSDIVHYFHMGNPVEYFLIYPDGRLETHVMGNRLLEGDLLQLTVSGGIWKASRMIDTGKASYSLISEAVSPGFDYQDMRLGNREQMIKTFPDHADLIGQMTRTKDSSDESDQL